MVVPEPMSDRRTIVLVLAVLAAILGAAITICAAIALRDPFSITGELGTRVEISSELIGAIIVGVLLIAGGIGTAVGLVRVQLRVASR